MALSRYNGFDGDVRLAVGRYLEGEFRAGRVPRPTECVACGQTEGAVIPHLEDYDKPVEGIMALCSRCHVMVHARFRHAALWGHYVRAIAKGYRFAPAPARGFFGEIVRQFATLCETSSGLSFTRHPPPERRILEEIASGKHDPRQRPT